MSAAPVLNMVQSASCVNSMPYLVSSSTKVLVSDDSKLSPYSVPRPVVAPAAIVVCSEQVSMNKKNTSGNYSMGMQGDMMTHAAFRAVLNPAWTIDTTKADSAHSWGFVTDARAHPYFRTYGLMPWFRVIHLHIAHVEFTSCTRESMLVAYAFFGSGDKDMSECWQDFPAEIAAEKLQLGLSALIEVDMQFSRDLGRALPVLASGIVDFDWKINTGDIEDMIIKPFITAKTLDGTGDDEENLWESGRLRLMVGSYGVVPGTKECRTEFTNETAFVGVYFVGQMIVFREKMSAEQMRTTAVFPVLQQYTKYISVTQKAEGQNAQVSVDISDLQAPLAGYALMFRRSDAEGFEEIDAGTLSYAPNSPLDPFVLTTTKLGGVVVNAMDGLTSRQTYGNWNVDRTTKLPITIHSIAQNMYAKQATYAAPLNKCRYTIDSVIHANAFTGGNTSGTLIAVLYYQNTAIKSNGVCTNKYVAPMGLSE
jgi:hypothetical protein